MRSVRITVGILSGLANTDQRNACRETWLADKALGVGYFFLIGQPSVTKVLRVHDDILWLPCRDDYPSLPQKTRLFCRWFGQNTTSEYLFKCDDDTYVRLDRLVAMPSGLDYCGGRIDRDRPYLSGGAGYLLSRKAAKIIAAGLDDLTGAEDLLVGRYLRQFGIKPVFDPRFSWNEANVPTPDNEVISTHYCSPERLRELHRANWS